MSYAQRAARFLAERGNPPPAVGLPREESEESEETPLPLATRDAAVLDALDDDLAAAAAADDGWTAPMRAAFAPVLHMPPEGCIGPRACSRLGPCERHARGEPCETEAAGGGEAG